MNEWRPKVSVIMGVFNCADTLDQALESIAAQTWTDWELVVCDDGSTDATPEVLNRWHERLAGQMTLLRNGKNSKLSYTLNRCLAAASGELVARMDGDDVSTAERLERQVAFLDAHPDVDLLGTWMRRFNDAGPADVVSVPAQPDRWSMREGVPFCHATIMARRGVFERVGNYTVSPRAVRNEDLDLWFRFFAADLSGANLPEPLYLVREDISAIRRRTVRARLNIFLTTVDGYRMLRYPLHWYLRPVLSLGKALVPASGTAAYRRFQKWRANRRDAA